MGEREEYADLVQRLPEILPGFAARQQESAQHIYDLLVPFIRRGEIDTIVDLGCGTGEILVSLGQKISEASASGAIHAKNIRLVGLDSSISEIKAAISKTDDPTIKFIHCDGSGIFIDDLLRFFTACFPCSVASFSGVMGKMAVICTGHTIFHLPYLPKLFTRMLSPSDRPRLWLVDVYRSWDRALEESKNNEVIEPRSVCFSADGRRRRIVNVLFTRRSKTSLDMVERGLYEISSTNKEEDKTLIVTLQHAWTIDELKTKFSAIGYMLCDALDSTSGYGEMTTLLYELPRRCIPILEYFIDSNKDVTTELLPIDQTRARSPLPTIKRWIQQSELLSTDSDDNFDFVLVEFAPYFDAWDGRKNLLQEVLLFERRDSVGKDSSLILQDYLNTLTALQKNELGLFVHPYFTGQRDPTAWGSIHENHIDVRGTSVLPHLADGERLLNDWQNTIASAKERADARIVSDVDSSSRGICVATSEVSLRGLQVDLDVPRIAARIEMDHRVLDLTDEILQRNYELKLELLHRLLRKIFGSRDSVGTNGFRTILISAPLRMLFSGESKGKDLIPKSYRGGVWVFAGTRQRYGRRRHRALKNLLELCLLTGMSSVEASASESLTEGIHRHAVRTAAVAIMSRNMSHNIGSHVLSGVTADVVTEQKVYDEVTERKRGEAKGDGPIGVRNQLFRYLQERMDFLAELSTSGSFMSLPMPLEDIVRSFCRQALLLKFITGTNDAGEIPNIHIDKPELGRVRGKKYFVSSPGGRNGCHALYVVFENLIRNSAKHRPPSRIGSIKLGVAVKEHKTRADILEVRIWDNANNGASIHKSFEGPLWRYINSVITSESIIKTDGTLKEGNWGIREVTIAAAYLRGIAIEDIEAKNHRKEIADQLFGAPLLKAVIVDREGNDSIAGGVSNLCYQFFMKRAKTLLLVDAGMAQDTGLNHDELRQHGIDIYSTTTEIPGAWADHGYLAAEPSVISGLKSNSDWPVRQVEIDLVRTEVRSGDVTKVWAAAAQAWKSNICKRHGLADARLYKGTTGASGCTSEVAWTLCDAALGSAVIYDHHALISLQAKELGKIDKALFWETYENYDDQCSLFEVPPEGAETALREEFITAGVARIIVLDERVQEAIETHPGKWGGFMLMADAVRRRRIHVPSRGECGLKAKPEWASIEDYLRGLDGIFDYLVVHLGILERVVTKVDGQGVALGWKRAMERMKCWAGKMEAELVICSGRGIPKEISEADVRFVQASSVERWVVHNPSKYHLYQLLSASRSPRHAQVPVV